MPQGFSATLDQHANCLAIGVNFPSRCLAACTTEGVRIWAKYPKIAQLRGITQTGVFE
jgi:hypothetical protein